MGVIDTRLEDIGWSPRVTRVFRSFYRMETVGDLMMCSGPELMRKRNFGRKSLEEIRRTLADLGVALAGDKPP